MKKVTITSELKSIFKELNIPFGNSYSDSRSDNKVGVKFRGVFLDSDVEKEVIARMESKGYKFSKLTKRTYGYEPRLIWSQGTRFTFYNK